MDLTLSKRGDYVLRSAICLARAYESGAPKKLREVSAEMNVPRTFVSQILGDLVHAGIAVSTFGTRGGYRLARLPAAVSLLDVVAAAEGPLPPERCALGDGPCRWEAVCPLHETWRTASASLLDVLDATSLATLAERDRRIEAGSYPIPPDAHRLRWAVVPVADSVQVELSAPAVAARLRPGGSWLTPHLEAALAEGEPRPVQQGVVRPGWFGNAGTVQLGETSGTDEDLVVPLVWEAIGPSAARPRLEAELRLVAVDLERVELRLGGRCRFPLPRAQRVPVDEALPDVVRTTVRAFLRRVAGALEEAAADPGPPAGGRA